MNKEKTVTCIVCPKGCKINITYTEDTDFKILIQSVSGFSCIKGKEYIEQEVINPLRTLTTTIKTDNPHQKRLAVRSDSEIPLKDLKKVIKYLRTIVIKAPVTAGTCIAEKPLGLQTNIIATDEVL